LGEAFASRSESRLAFLPVHEACASRTDSRAPLLLLEKCRIPRGREYASFNRAGDADSCEPALHRANRIRRVPGPAKLTRASSARAAPTIHLPASWPTTFAHRHLGEAFASRSESRLAFLPVHEACASRTDSRAPRLTAREVSDSPRPRIRLVQSRGRTKFGTSEGEANWSVTMQRGFARRNVATEQNGTRRFPEKGNRRLGQ
jgi:hypothetical protein